MDRIRSGHRNRYLQKGKGVLTGPFLFAKFARSIMEQMTIKDTFQM